MEASLDLVKICAMIAAFLVAIVGHEVMHGYVAYNFGDNTAKYQGRLSINPIVHIDPIGSILLPGALFLLNAPFLFGWAKPVPVNLNTVVRNGGYNAAIYVALAGVAYNFTVAIVCSILLPSVEFGGELGTFISFFIAYSIVYNVVLGYFNLLPIPTLDGAHAIEYMAIKLKFYSFAQKLASLERFGIVFLLILVATPLSKVVFQPAFTLIELLVK